MAWAKVQDAIGSQGGSGPVTLTITLSSSPTAGNLLVVATRSGTNAASISGYTQVSDTIVTATMHAQTFYKIATGSEGTSLAIQGTATLQATVIEFSNTGTAAVDTHGEASNASSVTVCAPGVTVAAAGSLAVFGAVMATGGGTWAAPSGFTAPAAGHNSANGMDYKLSTAAGATGDVSTTNSLSSINVGMLTIFAVGTTVSPPAATATASAPAPGVGPLTVAAPAATASGAAAAPVPRIAAPPPAATATATAPAPGVGPLTVVLVPATATAEAAAPVLVIPIDVAAATAEAIAAALAPTILAYQKFVVRASLALAPALAAEIGLRPVALAGDVALRPAVAGAIASEGS